MIGKSRLITRYNTFQQNIINETKVITTANKMDSKCLEDENSK